MAHFAKLDENNIVIDVLVVSNDILLKTDGTESEYKGKVFLNGLFGNATWVQTSYNSNFRKQYAGIGFTYDETNDVFISIKPFNSWTLDSNFEWQPPTSYPTDNRTYSWNETNLSWDLFPHTLLGLGTKKIGDGNHRHQCRQMGKFIIGMKKH
jgi:hypothetical protein